MRFFVLLTSLVFAHGVYALASCKDIGLNIVKEDGFNFIDIPNNRYSSYRVEDNHIYQLLEIDIDNDGYVERVAQFIGGNLSVPYLIILKNGESQTFGTDYCGAGSPKEINLIEYQNNNYVYVQLQPNLHCIRDERELQGYLIDYKDAATSEVHCHVLKP